jgi:hypothetical protein
MSQEKLFIWTFRKVPWSWFVPPEPGGNFERLIFLMHVDFTLCMWADV